MIFICPFTITSNTILVVILITSGEEGVDLKWFVKVVDAILTPKGIG